MNYREEFKNLVQEIDYQERYSYEERVDLYNKYQIGTATKYFNPIMVLSEYIFMVPIQYNNFRCHGMSHSGAVQTSFNKEFKENISKYINLKLTNEKLDYYDIFHYLYNPSRLEKKVSFRVRDDGITIILKNVESLTLKKGECMYERCNEFLRDFKYPELF
jgi:hypothetical protein